MKTYYTEDYKVEITLDDWASSPREWDNLGTMLTWQNKYRSPDKHEFPLPGDFIEWWNENCGVDGIIMPIYCLDHGNVSYSTKDYHDRCDSGQVGFIYVTSDDLAKEGMTPADAMKVLEGEVENYSLYAQGEVYSINITQKSQCSTCEHIEWEFVEGCGGFLGGIDPDYIPDALLEEIKSDGLVRV